MGKSIKIAGAGISGLTAAINLARKGYEVEVYEKNLHLGRYNICAVRNYDLSEDALKEFEACGVKLKPRSFVKRVVKFSPNHLIEEHSRKSIFYIFERGPARFSIEHQLYTQAKNLGVDIVFGRPAKENEVDIVATGARRTDILAYGYVYRGLDIKEHTAYIIYNNLYAPKGYIYILTAGRKTVVVAVSFDKKSFRYLPVNFTLFIRKNEFVRKMVGRRNPVGKIGGFGNYDIVRSAVRNGKYYVGERGFFMDASKGFGIRYAILTGYLAAKAIIEDEDYDRLWRERIGEELKRDFKRRILLNRLTNNDYDMMLSRMGKCVDIDRYTKETRKTQKHIDLFLPLYLWKWKISNRFGF